MTSPENQPQYAKADLMTFPSFYSPRDSPNIPSLKQILEAGFTNGLDILALTACHSGAGGMDERWQHYASSGSDERKKLRGRFKMTDEKGYLLVEDKEVSRSLILLRSQKVRTVQEKEHPRYVQINVLGVDENILPSRDLNTTLDEARSKRGIVLLADVDEKMGVTLEKAINLYKNDQVDGIQTNASAPKETSSRIMRTLADREIAIPVAVSNAHDYRFAGTSQIIMLSNNLWSNFSIAYLKGRIRENDFGISQGYIPAFQRFMTRDRHILYGTIRGLFNRTKRKENLAAIVGK